MYEVYYCIKGHEHEYETQTTIQVFRPNGKYVRVCEPPETGICVLAEFSEEHGSEAVIFVDNAVVARAETAVCGSDEKGIRKAVIISIYKAFLGMGEREQPWGVLNGIRPAKIVHNLWQSGFSDDDVKNTLLSEYLVSPRKVELCMAVAKAEKEILRQIRGGDLGLYIGVPFCPSRCLYCSFTSFPIGKYEKKLPEYFDAFEKELKNASEYAKKRNIKSVYVGGGTPTALSDYFLDRLLCTTAENFDINGAEFTVEAGRPETITLEKLKILKKYNVTRISINPQTLDGETLKRIGRGHTPKEFLNAYKMAENEGFININTDVILGLPGESADNVANTFEKITRLSPKSVTVHTLAVKRASALNQNFGDFQLASCGEIEKMLTISAEYCEKMNLSPYYMYRQKNMTGNYENVGYCADGFICEYNVQIMEERQDIIAVGPGGSTKLIGGEKGRIKRIFGPKGIEEYIAKVDSLIENKVKAGIF